MITKPVPALATWMLNRFVLGPDAEAIAGDIQEAYGLDRSRFWLWRQTLAAVCLTAVSCVRSNKGAALYATAVGWLMLTEFGGLAAAILDARIGPAHVALWNWRSVDLYVYAAIVCVSAAAAGAIVSLLHGRLLVLLFAATVIVVDAGAIARYPWIGVSHRAFLLPAIALLGLMAAPLSVVVGGVVGPQRSVA